jgi:ABC-type multidrug transport system fused ATPase/permease subunit
VLSTTVRGSTALAAVAVAIRERIALCRRLTSVGRGLLAAILALTVIGSLIPATTAIAFAALIARVQRGGAADLVAAAVAPLVVYVAVLLVGHVVATVRKPLYYLAVSRIDGAHRARLAHMASTSPTIGALERSDVQALIRQARADPESFMEGTIGPGSLAQLDLIGRVLALVSSGAVLAAYAWWLVPVVLLPAVGVHLFDVHEGGEWRRVWRESVAPSARAGVWSDAIVSADEGKEIRIFGLADWALSRIQHFVTAGFDPMWTVGWRVLSGLWRPFLLVLVPLGIAYGAVAIGAVDGRASVAVAAAVFAAATSVYQALADQKAHLVINATGCMNAFDALRRELGVGELSAGESGAGIVAPTAVTDRVDALDTPLIRLENVSFTYPGTDRQVLDQLDLEIRPGELLAVVGLNGAGKSTLIKLLACLYEPTFGRITAGGVDLATLGPTAWRARISIVFQDFVRYHLSAADNVTLGNAAIPRDAVALDAAARDAGLDKVVERLPRGWDTPLARSRTGGVDLSGGQWQQVVLARALYAVRTGAQLLVLDEPTAHLDVRTEFDVFGRLAARKGDATVVLISHRLSTVRQADRIVVVADGRIAESGNHDELMACGGQYAAMFAIQASRFQRGYDDRIEEGELT